MTSNRLLSFFRLPVGDVPGREDLPAVPYRWAPVVFLGLLLSILLITWPWAKTLSTEFIEHWDPPFHAWKLEMMSRSILAGHLLPVDGDTNMLYPNTGALYHEALQWPQALVAAPFFALPHANPILIYHGVLLSFWALSGVCLWMLLLALGTTRRAALMGALFFTLMPYSVSYMVEFNMKLNFALPLFFFFIVRYVQRPSIRYACGMALAWWLQAVSELYQAIFMLLLLPFIGLPLLAVHFRLLGSWRKFWLPALCAGVLGVALTLAFLMPYLVMLDAQSIHRSLREVRMHALEPLSYFCSVARFQFLPIPNAKYDEMLVYPTAVMLVLAGLFAAQRVFSRFRTGPWGLGGWARAVRNVSLCLFAVLTFGIYGLGMSAWVAQVYSALPVVATLAALVALVFPVRRDLPELFLSGLFAAAVFAFFMSLGPILGIHAVSGSVSARNYLYFGLYHYLDALGGFRVVSRFSIFPLLFMCVASAFAWTRIERQWLQPRGWRALWILPVFLLALEAVPVRINTHPLDVPNTSPVLDSLDRLENPYVLAVVPMSDRYYTSRHMLQIGRQDRLFAYGWGGAFPPYSKKVEAALNPGNAQPERAAALLRQLWPDCLVLEDKTLTRGAIPNLKCNYTQWLANETEQIAEDNRFSLLRFKPRPEATVEEIRLIRADWLRANPIVHFRAKLDDGQPATKLYLDVNGYLAGTVRLTSEAQDFSLRVPRDHVVKLFPNRLRFHAAADTPFHLEAFRASVAPADAMVEPPAVPDDCPPWVGHLQTLPATAQKLDISYGNALEILACEMPQTTVAPGGELVVRYYIQCHASLKTLMRRSITTRLYPVAGGRWIEQDFRIASNMDLNDYLCQSQFSGHAGSGIYAIKAVVHVPPELTPGDYTPFVLLKDGDGARLRGMQNGERNKMFPLPYPVHVQP